MSKQWWKILAVLIMVFVIIAGLLIPLKPGIYTFSPTRVNPGQLQEISIVTYNTHLKTAKNNQVWLKLPDDQLIAAHSINILSENQLKASFLITDNYSRLKDRDRSLTLIVDNEIDGYTLYPSAIRLGQSNTLASTPQKLQQLDQVNDVDSFRFPYRPILHETIRNTFFHVAIWFAMFILLIVSCVHSVKYLMTRNMISDTKSSALTTVALYFGIAGILTGSMWAKYTWGTFWTSDIKLNMSAVALLVYFAYWLLRSSISDIDTRARVSAVYNIFAFVTLMILVMVIPRFTDSLHPGNGGNPALGGEDLDNTLRVVFYPAIIGYTLLGLWISQLYFRYLCLQDKYLLSEY